MKKIEIIAEIAQGYEGKKDYLDQLVSESLKSEADSIKIQLVYADELSTKDYKYYNLFKQLEMDTNIWKNISDKIHSNNKKLYFDIFGDQSLNVANLVDADGVKISTTEFYNRDLIDNALNRFNKVFISIGGIELDHIESLIEEKLYDFKEKITLIYGFQAEPTLLEQNNLRKLNSFIVRYPDFNFGFMDHSHGDKEESLYLSLLTLGMGINAIEKHFTLDRKLKIEDYISGLNYLNFKKFVRIIRKYETALGYPGLKLSDVEIEYSKKALKVAVASVDIKKNELLSRQNIALKRTGIESNENMHRELDLIIGKKANKFIHKDKPILKEDL